MTPLDYEYLRKLLKERSGLDLSADKQYLVESRLVPLARKSGLPGIPELVQKMKGGAERADGGGGRGDDHQRDLLLPRQDSVRSSEGDGASGADAGARGPPRLAHLVRGFLDRAGAVFDRDVPEGSRIALLAGWRIEIVATDLSQAVLEKSKAGIFSQFEVQRGLPIQMLVKYFTQNGELWQLNADIRGMVQHRQLNLLQDFSHLGTFDVIFCRNVLIYFDQDTKVDIFERLVADARARRRAGAGRGRIRGRHHRRLQALSGSARALSPEHRAGRRAAASIARCRKR